MKTSFVRPPAVSILAAAALLAGLTSLQLSPAGRAESPVPSSDDGSAGDTALGSNALPDLSDGGANTALGYGALFSNTTGNHDMASGYAALYYNTTGYDNTASGASALVNNTTGSDNTANGADALYVNTTGGNNTASGYEALFSNTTGSDNTASGANALYVNTTGTGNLAGGVSSLYNNTTGNYNVASGVNALYNNTTGGYNLADGENALTRNTTGSSNIGLGHSAGSKLTTGSNNIDIANAGVAAESNVIRIGTSGTQKNAYVAGISGVTVAGGASVVIDSTGHLGVVTSSARFKDEIKPMAQSSEAIYALQPVTFAYKPELDPAHVPQFGLVAEQVAAVSPDLVLRNEEGQVYTVRYEAVNAMLLNEFLKEHRTVQAQTATITQLQATEGRQQQAIATLSTTLEQQAALLKKLSAQLEVRPPVNP